MTTKEFLELSGASFKECIEIFGDKNPDYAGTEGEDDVLSGFKRISKLTGVDVKTVWNVFAAKHFDAIMNSASKPLKSETLQGRIRDLINYCNFREAIEKEVEDAGIRPRLQNKRHVEVVPNGSA
jgi:hypothetical protein